MKKTFWILSATLVLLVPVLTMALPIWRENLLVNVEQNHLKSAKEALAQRHFGEALKLVELHLRGEKAAFLVAWKSLQIEALAGLKNIGQLTKLFENQAWPVKEHESASLLVARGYLAEKNHSAFRQILEQGLREGQAKASWFMLKADCLMKEGESDASAEWLNSAHFKGGEEAARLSRLALLAGSRKDFAKSWSLLEIAHRASPKDADVISFRAQILEAAGKLNEAGAEYESAMAAQPTNPLLHDQLADFQLRHGLHDAALKTMRDALIMPHPDYMRLKTLFWSQVIDGLPSAPSTQVYGSDLSSVMTLIEGGRSLTLQETAKLSPAVSKRPEVFWLSLIETLYQHREQDALNMLCGAEQRIRNLDLDLFESLMITLKWRLTQTLPAEMATMIRQDRPRHSYLDKLYALYKTPDSDSLRMLESPFACTACFIACGWREIALRLRPGPSSSAEAPPWLIYGIAQSLRMNQRPDEALQYIEKHSLTTDELQLLHAELLLVMGQQSRGLALLKSLQQRPGPASERADMILLLSQTNTEKNVATKQIFEASTNRSESKK